MTPSPAFVTELSQQRAIAREDMRTAAERGDEPGVQAAVNRLADLRDIARRNGITSAGQDTAPPPGVLADHP